MISLVLYPSFMPIKKWLTRGRCPALSAVVLLAAGAATAEVCNLKIVTDASPDYSDLPSLLQAESRITLAVQPRVLAPETHRV